MAKLMFYGTVPNAYSSTVDFCLPDGSRIEMDAQTGATQYVRHDEEHGVDYEPVEFTSFALGGLIRNHCQTVVGLAIADFRKGGR